MRSFQHRQTLVILTIAIAFSACQQREGQGEPEGVTVTKHKATAKPGFEFVKTGVNTAQARRNNDGATTGDFTCACSGGGPCDVTISGGFLICSTNHGCGSGGACELSVTVGSGGGRSGC